MSFIFCHELECDNRIPNHVWGKIKKGEGWFIQKDGTAFCPNHIPEWVEEWRKSKSLK